jgi:hypothetical protein
LQGEKEAMNKSKSPQVLQIGNDLRELANSTKGIALLLIPNAMREIVQNMEEYAEKSPFGSGDYDGYLFGCFVRFEERYSMDIETK